MLEPTSGNTGIALAMVAARKGYRLTVVIPDNASEERIGLLRLFGAEIVFSDGDKGTNGSIEVARALAADDKYYMPFQYGNPANPLAHEQGTAEEIIRDLPAITHFVAGMGTGGTLTGNGRRAARAQPRHAGDRGGAGAGRPGLRATVARCRVHPADLRSGAGQPEVPGGFLELAAHESRRSRRARASSPASPAGRSCYVAQRIAQEIDEGDIVCLLPDGGWKYLSTEAWADGPRGRREGRRGVAVVVTRA